MKCSLGISDFLEEISSLSHSVVLPYFFALIAEAGFLISSCYSLELCIQMLISFLFSFAFFASLLFTAICKASSDSHFAFCISFPQGWSWSLSPVQCHEPHSIVHQALYLYRYDLRTTIIKKYPIHFQILPSLLRLPVLPTLYKYWLDLPCLTCHFL